MRADADAVELRRAIRRIHGFKQDRGSAVRVQSIARVLGGHMALARCVAADLVGVAEAVRDNEAEVLAAAAREKKARARPTRAAAHLLPATARRRQRAAWHKAQPA